MPAYAGDSRERESAWGCQISEALAALPLTGPTRKATRTRQSSPPVRLTGYGIVTWARQNVGASSNRRMRNAEWSVSLELEERVA